MFIIMNNDSKSRLGEVENETRQADSSRLGTNNTKDDSTSKNADNKAEQESNTESILMELMSKLETAQQKNDELSNALKYSMAEAANIRSRAERDQKEFAKYALSGIMKDLVQILDQLQMGLAFAPQESDNGPFKGLHSGVQMTLGNFLKIVESHGMKQINPLNSKFDPAFHQVVASIPAEGVPSGIVTEVKQIGYELNGRIVRPAMVVIAS
jgi:molecular chaperone GrpE